MTTLLAGEGSAAGRWLPAVSEREQRVRTGRNVGSPVGAGWLAAVIPADCRRVRVHDRQLADALTAAGAEQVERDPDVEIARSVRDIRGDAALALVLVDPLLPTSRRVTVRVARRLAVSVRARLYAERARRGLRRRGYGEATVLLWDARQRVGLPDVPPHRPRLVERLPARALAIGRRGDTGPSALQAVLVDASRETGVPLRLRWVSIRSGILLAEAEEGILRVAIGPGRVQIESQATALETLGGDQLPAAVADRVPWLLARGRTGLADWSLERRLPGTRPAAGLPDQLARDCLEFLVALHRAPGGESGGQSLSELAEIAAGVCGRDGAGRARSLAARLDAALAGVRRGFGHGDFFAGNLLAEDGRLTGVLDWDAAGPGRLPLVDLLHLELTQRGYGTDNEWGPTLLEHLLPAARDGGGEHVRRYCRNVGLDPHPRLLEGLVLSYWLGYVAYQLRTHPARRSEPLWIERNVEGILREVEPPRHRR